MNILNIKFHVKFFLHQGCLLVNCGRFKKFCCESMLMQLCNFNIERKKFVIFEYTDFVRELPCTAWSQRDGYGLAIVPDLRWWTAEFNWAVHERGNLCSRVELNLQTRINQLGFLQWQWASLCVGLHWCDWLYFDIGWANQNLTFQKLFMLLFVRENWTSNSARLINLQETDQRRFLDEFLG